MPAARIGTACTEANPPSRAAGTKRGHRPTAAAQVGDRYRTAGGVALDARPFVGLQLEELQFARLLRGRRQEAQLLQRVGEQKARGSDVEQLRAARREVGQQVHHVEVVEQAVDEGDDGVQHLGFARGVGHLALRPDLFASFVKSARISRPPASVGGRGWRGRHRWRYGRWRRRARAVARAPRSARSPIGRPACRWPG